MSAITIDLSDEQAARLQAVAAQFKVTPEDLVRASLDDLLSRPNDAFEQTVDYVLRKNRELYQRLA